MSSGALKQTSYVVLGLVETCEPATPYDLKRFAEISVFNFWSIPHTQIYTECARLAASGHLDEQREESGRRRRVYRLTEVGRAALQAWREEPSFKQLEFRDVGLIKLFFGADPGQVACAQLEGHHQILSSFEELRQQHPEMPVGMRLALEAGIGHEREFVRFWSRLAEAAKRDR